MNLISRFLQAAARHPDRTAIIEESGRAISYAALAERSARLAAAWHRQGLRRGDRVLLAMPVGIDLFAAIAGLWRLGAVAVFPEPALGLPGLRHAVHLTRPRALLSASWYRLLRLIVPQLWSVPLSLRLTPETAKPDDAMPENVPADHPALISFTTGSTGAPKAIERSHGFLAAQNACIARFLAPEQGVEGRDIVAFPAFTIANLGFGVTSILPGKRTLRAKMAHGLRTLMERHGATRALIPPAVCEKLAREPACRSLKAIFTGGGPVFPDLLLRLRDVYPRARICAVYGSTEAEPIAWIDVSGIAQEDFRAMMNGGGLLAGPPIPEVRLKIIDGEIVVAGEHVNKGYLDGRGDAGNKLRLEGEIWHRTGDAGRLDSKGRLWLLGRHSVRAGDFWPFMVEAPARTWPGVRRAALVPGRGSPILAIEGDSAHLFEWQRQARTLGDLRVVHVSRMPMDRRHESKIDLRRLQRMLNGH